MSTPAQREAQRKYHRSPRGKAVHKAWRDANKSKIAEYNARAKEKNPDLWRKSNRKHQGVKNATGEKRTGPCQICDRVTDLHYDHDHTTGLFRGWLCPQCNRAIGLMQDDPQRLRKAAEYLEKT